MKRIFPGFFAVILFMSFACGTLKYNKVYSYDDEFIGKDKKYTRLRIRPDERRTEIGLVRVIMEKTTGREGELVSAYFVINRSSSSFNAGMAGFVRAGGETFELVLKDPVSELRTRSDASILGIATFDSLGFVSGQAVDIDTRTWIEEKFVMNLNDEIVSAILGAGDLVFRFYFGPIPVTYGIRGTRLAAVKKVFSE